MNNRQNTISINAASQNIENQKNDEKNAENFHSHLVKASVGTALTAGTIATACFPFEWFQTQKQMSAKTPWSLIMTAAFAKPLLKAYEKACTMSLIRNGVNAQRDHVNNGVNKVLDLIPKDGNSNHLQHQAIATGVTSAGLAIVNTAITGKLSKDRFYQEMHRPIPALNSIKDKIKYYRLGSLSRFTNTMTNNFICLGAVTMIQPYVDRALPYEKYGILGLCFTTVGSGTLAGVLLTGAERIYKTRLLNADLSKFYLPSFSKTVKEIIAKDGLKDLVTKGAGMSCMINTMAFLGFNLVGHYMNHGYDEHQKWAQAKFQTGKEQANRVLGKVTSIEEVTVEDEAAKATIEGQSLLEGGLPNRTVARIAQNPATLFGSSRNQTQPKPIQEDTAQNNKRL